MRTKQLTKKKLIGDKPKLYISGPMTGIQDFNFPAFFAAEEELKKSYYVFNPANNPEMENYTDYLRKDIEYLIQCQVIYMLKGWKKSVGASLEHRIAKVLGFEIIYQ